MKYGINPTTGRCRQCGKLQFRIETDGMGRSFEVPKPCPCPKKRAPRSQAWREAIDHDRRRACLCQLCDEPTAGKPKVALYCEGHREKRRQTTARRKSQMRKYSRQWRADDARETAQLRQRVRELESKLRAAA